MHCPVTLSAEEFKTIHNALCELDSLSNRLESVVNQQLWTKLQTAKSDIRKGLKSAYAQESQDFDQKTKHYEAIAQKHNLSSIWSMYEIGDLTKNHNFGKSRYVVYKDHWGSKPVQMQITGNTWADLYTAADACIKASGDTHHVFIEKFVERQEDGETVVYLHTGS